MTEQNNDAGMSKKLTPRAKEFIIEAYEDINSKLTFEEITMLLEQNFKISISRQAVNQSYIRDSKKTEKGEVKYQPKQQAVKNTNAISNKNKFNTNAISNKNKFNTNAVTEKDMEHMMNKMKGNP